MKPRIPITVIRSPKERIAKCSLRHLAARSDVTFHVAHGDFRFPGSGFTLLTPEAPVLCAADGARPLLLLDSSWRHLPRLLARVEGTPIPRSLPRDVPTAYPRRSKVFVDPPSGLASIEALYLAKLILGEDDIALLDGYHWREQFLAGVAAAGLRASA